MFPYMSIFQVGDMVELKTYRHYLDDGLISGDKGIIESFIEHDNQVVGYVVRFSNGLDDIYVNASLSDLKLITSHTLARTGLVVGSLLIVATAILGLISIGVVSEVVGLISFGILCLFLIN
ncbi:hypothetical protein CrLKS4_g56 [Cylindrospermopsis phage Cr-LKS4]|nr:hypothetical protein CrLKS4_g56 [Cylindrospermopsis phage Cr-LKS4]